ncbi:MAG: hypothetical protein E4G99_03205 [Anaerolineales bacterium]|nr:MAG: hypothetical protein E4G99_03205 [Anaerolineales bacterium]
MLGLSPSPAFGATASVEGKPTGSPYSLGEAVIDRTHSLFVIGPSGATPFLHVETGGWVISGITEDRSNGLDSLVVHADDSAEMVAVYLNDWMGANVNLRDDLLRFYNLRE